MLKTKTLKAALNHLKFTHWHCRLVLTKVKSIRPLLAFRSHSDAPLNCLNLYPIDLWKGDEVAE